MVEEPNLTVVYGNFLNKTRIRPLADARGYIAEHRQRSGSSAWIVTPLVSEGTCLFGRFQSPLVVFGQGQGRAEANKSLKKMLLVNGEQIAFQGREWERV